ncbi:hypothetical protein DFH28DRAFT_1084796 [Melampsora americana]|nr:hypothetical protein DFH28DRAFT_1084796 [Melampsora americana]
MLPTNPPRALWVSNAELLAHLTLLNAFHHLRELRPEPEFLHMALFRFELWVARLTPEPFNVETLPPLDVLMVWHAYCLTSRAYYEDSRRLYPVLHTIEFPLALAATQYLRPRQKAHPLRVAIPHQAIINWYESTNTDYCPIGFFKNPSLRTFLCPICKSAIQSSFTNLTRTGWAESYNCRLDCGDCKWKGTKADLATHRLLYDIQSLSSSPLLEYVSLAGTLCTTKILEDKQHAATFNLLVTRILASIAPSSAKQRLYDPQAAIQTIKVLTAVPKISSTDGVNQMLSAYSVPEPFSTDLILAMKRQESFTKSIVELGWTEAACSRDVETVSQITYSGFAINRAVSRYQAFVDLLKIRDGTSFDTCVPTYDIDLAWRTHQLAGVRYSKEMSTFLGRSVDQLSFARPYWAFQLRLIPDFRILTTLLFDQRVHGVPYSQYPTPDYILEQPYPLLKSKLAAPQTKAPKEQMGDRKPAVRFVIEEPTA